MKKYKFKIILVVSAFVVSSCSNDFIELSSISEASTNAFYNTSSDFENAVVASYDALQSDNLYGEAFDRLIAIRADDAVDDNSSSSTRASDVDKFQETATNGFVDNAWKGTYLGISRCNIVVSRIDQTDFDSSTKSELKAEAQFIRALLYFNAVRIWGDIPLVLKEQTVLEVNQQIQDKTLIRNSVSDIYEAIVDDLAFAEQNLPATNSRGRATSGAAKALLGKVYLTLGNYPLAASKLNEVIGKYKLLPNIADVFDVSKKDNEELIFVVAYDKNVSGEGHAAWYSNDNFIIVPQSLFNSYDASDKRRPLVVTSQGTKGILPQKFFDLEVQSQVGNDFPVLRYSDVLLMRAEVLNEIGFDSDPNAEALDLLNQVRVRAGLNAYTNLDLTNQQEFRDAVLLERKLEFALEYQRWFDLLRTNSAITEMAKVGLTITNDDLLFPIPQSEIEIVNNPSGFGQNPGY